MFHDDKGPVVDTYRRLCSLLQEAHIQYVVIGAMALAAHRFRRATEDVDLCVRAGDLARFRQEFVGKVYQAVEGRPRRFLDPETQVTFDFLVAGQLAGNTSKNKVVTFPDPSEAVEIEGTMTVPLEKLIALKLVTWRYKDWGDVVELIRRNDLGEEYAASLPELVRSAYLQCYDQKVEEDRYEQEQGVH